MSGSHAMNASSGPAGETNPFLRYRDRLAVYEPVARGEVSDDRFVDIVSTIDARVAEVWGHGFEITPLVDGSALAAASDLACPLSIKIEAGNVGGSHKARHLMGVMIHDQLRRAMGATTAERLAIASCGNAAIGASVIARAMDRPLDVFVPTWADDATIAVLSDFGAHIHRCERRAGESGDPCYLRFREAVDPDRGAEATAAFGVQSTDTPMTLDGARTIGFEIAEQVEAGAGAPDAGPVDALYVQVGGGALATATACGLPGVRLHPVQAEGCAPLARAWDRWGPTFDIEAALAPDQQFMTPWKDPHSMATGILDDVTYDWVPLLQLTRERGGHPIVAPEALIEKAYRLVRTCFASSGAAVRSQGSSVPAAVSATGTAGFAGLLAEPPTDDGHVAVLFTGIDRR